MSIYQRLQKMIGPVAKDGIVTYDDVEPDETTLAFAIRKKLGQESRRTGGV